MLIYNKGGVFFQPLGFVCDAIILNTVNHKVLANTEHMTYQ